MTASAVVWLVMSLGLMLTELRLSARGARSTVTVEARASDEILIILTMLALILPVSLSLVSSDLGTPTLPTMAVGALSAGVGLSLRCAAMVGLRGRYRLSPTVQPDHTTLITDGPFAQLRHPGYAGLLLAFGGLSLVAAGWVGLVFVAPMALAVHHRITLVARPLALQFVQLHAAYCRSVPWRMLPHVY